MLRHDDLQVGETYELDGMDPQTGAPKTIRFVIRETGKFNFNGVHLRGARIQFIDGSEQTVNSIYLFHARHVETAARATAA